jgi:hypothetical protein
MLCWNGLGRGRDCQSLAPSRILLGVKGLFHGSDHLPEFVHTDRWTTGKVVMWDNRCTMHRAREYDETKVRDMHRTTISDGVPTVLEQAAA